MRQNHKIMKYSFLLFFVLVLYSCNKEKDSNDNQTGIASFIFSPGGAESQVSYYSFSESRQILEKKAVLYQVRESVKIGDEIKLGMQTFGNPVGNFEIRLLINNRHIRTVKLEDTNNKTLYLTHKVTLEDLNTADDESEGSTTIDNYHGELKFKFTKPLYTTDENIEFYFYTPANQKYTLSSFDGSLLDYKDTNPINAKPGGRGTKKFTVTELTTNHIYPYETKVVESGSLYDVFTHMRKEFITNSIGTFHTVYGEEYDRWVPPLISNSRTGSFNGYRWLRTLNVNTLEGLYGQYEYYFTDNLMDSITVNHGNLVYDPYLSTHKVYNDVNAVFGPEATKSNQQRDSYTIEVNGYSIDIYVHDGNVFSKIKRIL